MPDATTPNGSRTPASAIVSLVMGLMALLGLPARPLMRLISPATATPGGLFLTMVGLQMLLAVGAVVLGLRTKPAVDGHRPASAHAGITLGGLTLSLFAILAVALTFNHVSNSMDRPVAETEPVILLQD